MGTFTDIKLEPQTRTAFFNRASINKNKRTVALRFSSERGGDTLVWPSCRGMLMGGGDIVRGPLMMLAVTGAGVTCKQLANLDDDQPASVKRRRRHHHQATAGLLP